ncbi:hypothetical protein STSP1_00973 [Sedimentisphaera salicampi]|uniref:Uncharacterized protein n=1 Tax=Sedimentisphaera salicampi TaxID=1941349 RepID=A0A1W6LLC2_9BACT|nr:hypothetical protein STSP1_00973 [Sedimentisphaera salicampi]
MKNKNNKKSFIRLISCSFSMFGAFIYPNVIADKIPERPRKIPAHSKSVWEAIGGDFQKVGDTLCNAAEKRNSSHDPKKEKTKTG